MNVPVYLVLKRTGQFTSDGIECVIVIDAKLTRSAAETIARHHGAYVEKLVANKTL